MILNFIIDSSSFEKGLGNVTIWSKLNDPKVIINAYLPLFTIQELDFQRFKRKSVVAKKALHFIDQLKDSASFKLHLEYPELNEAISWNETAKLSYQQGGSIPIRFKKLLKSCYYKCHYRAAQDVEGDSEGSAENADPSDKGWVLVTEDDTVRGLAEQFQIPYISVVEADAIINACIKDPSYVGNQDFSKKVIKRANKVKEQQGGKKVFVTSFDSDFLAPRNKGGELWTPNSNKKKS
ncbi:unnamed protein product [Kluyveromyces dobzhanskii CBS 2104]|uniref:WGS project CCBQ000000000 data, contig 00041 n=1 Tax=Kluyveromyces dobzhanskii CBS 2104 TaxID=1427455 RepID=A0A0A8L2I0_9SACH|nr:unnamed protein product [Kluyveromyces dobzhanskii CBS 2104]